MDLFFHCYCKVKEDKYQFHRRDPERLDEIFVN